MLQLYLTHLLHEMFFFSHSVISYILTFIVYLRPRQLVYIYICKYCTLVLLENILNTFVKKKNLSKSLYYQLDFESISYYMTYLRYSLRAIKLKQAAFTHHSPRRSLAARFAHRSKSRACLQDILHINYTRMK